MNVTPELVEYAKKEIGIAQYIEPADKVTANHILFKHFQERTKWKQVPKIIFYILMQEQYGPPYEKDIKGDLGYRLEVKVTEPVTTESL